MIPHDAGKPDPTAGLPYSTRDNGPIAGRLDPAPFVPAGFAPPAPAALTASPDLMSLLACLRQRWAAAVMLGGTLAAIACVGVYLLLAPKALASAILRAEAYPEGLNGRAPGSPNDFKTYLMTTAGAIKSLPTIQAALKRDAVRRLRLEDQEDDPAQAIFDDLRVEVKENSELITIYFPHRDPHVAATVADAIKEAFVDDIMEGERSRRAARFNKLEKSYNEADEALKLRIKNRDQALKTAGGVDPKLWQLRHVETTNALRDARQQAVTIGLKLLEARATLRAFDLRVKLMKARPAEKAKEEELVLQDEIDKALDADNTLAQLEGRLSQIDAGLSALKKIGVPRTQARYSNLETERETVAEQVEKRKAEVIKRVKAAVARARPRTPGTDAAEASPAQLALMRGQHQEQVDALVKLHAEQEDYVKKLAEEAAKIPVYGDNYERDVAEIGQQQKTLEELRQERERARLAMQDASRLTKWQDAQLVKQDIKKQVLAAGVAPLAVFGAVAAGLAWLEFRKRRVRSAGQVSRGLGIRVVGAVPNAPHLERQLGGAGDPELEGTPVMESIDAIRTRLLHEAQARSTRLVMVTSATAGEGKTTVAAALATSLARAGRKALLLDGDLRRPTLHELFECAMQPGLSEVLLGEIEVAEAAVESAQENLWLLPAGQWDREVLQALARDGLEGAFEKLADEFDFIVIDSHPVLSANDSLLLGRQVDAVLLSVLSGVSEMPRVYAAARQLEAVGARVLGAVVNAADPEEVYTAPPALAAA